MAKSVNNETTLTILGCGTSSGVPLLHCDCRVCRSRDPKNKRLRASAWIRIRGKSFLIDTSTDLRQQALRERIPRVDAVLFTHPHADHVHGIDELRSFNFVQRQSIPVYGNEWTRTELVQKFSYIFEPPKYVEGGGIPQLTLQPVDSAWARFDVLGVPVTPIALQHGSKECLGYRFDRIAYVTDCSYIPASSLNRMRGLDVLVLDCLRLQPHGTHFNLDQALAMVEELKPGRTYLTHLSHDFEYATWNGRPGRKRRLPKSVYLAYDGLKIRSKPLPRGDRS